MSTPDLKPQRKRRVWPILLPVLLLAILGVAMAIPGSPIYLAKLLEPEVSIDGRSRSQWVIDLSSPDAKQRTTAAAALGKMNTSGKKALPDLIRVMQSDPDGDVRNAASEAAAKMFPTTESEAAKTEYAATVTGPFTAGLTDADLRVRHNSAMGLLKLKDKARPAVPALLAAVKDMENDTNLTLYLATVRQVMLRALGEAAAGTPDAVPTFAAILDEKVVKPNLPGGGIQPRGDVSPEVTEASRKYMHGKINRRIAVTGLGLAGEHGKGSAAKIRELLTSDDPDDRDISAEALKRLGEQVEGK